MISAQIAINQRDVNDLPVEGVRLLPAWVKLIDSEQVIFLTLMARNF